MLLRYTASDTISWYSSRGHIIGPREAAVLAAALAELHGGGRALPGILATGAPGTGKTRLGELLAEMLGGEFIFAQLHEWSGADELLAGVDAAAAVAGDAGHVRRLGVLAQAAEMSQEQPVVLLLDEIDKASEAAEALLLDFMQSGRAEVAPGQHIVAHAGHLLVWATSNEQRPHSEALLRRFRRLRMQPLGRQDRIRVIAATPGVAPGVAATIDRLAEYIRDAEGSEHGSSISERIRAASDVTDVAETLSDVQAIAAAWLAREEAGEAAIYKGRGKQLAAAVLAELTVARRHKESQTSASDAWPQEAAE